MHPNQTDNTMAGTGATAPEERDRSERERQQKLMHEAAERTTFHRVECERWERIGRAAAHAAQELEAATPVAQCTPEDWLGATSPQQPSYSSA